MLGTLFSAWQEAKGSTYLTLEAKFKQEVRANTWGPEVRRKNTFACGCCRDSLTSCMQVCAFHDARRQERDTDFIRLGPVWSVDFCGNEAFVGGSMRMQLHVVLQTRGSVRGVATANEREYDVRGEMSASHIAMLFQHFDDLDSGGGRRVGLLSLCQSSDIHFVAQCV